MAFFSSIGDFFASRTAFQNVLFAMATMGVLEWLCFAFATIFTLLNVLRNPDKTTSIPRIFIVAFAYLTLRAVFIPFYLVCFAPNLAPNYLPTISRVATVILAIWWNCVITLPCLTVWYSRMRYGIGNDPLPLTKTQYKFTILLPVYNEELSLLVEGVESIINSDYEPSRMEIHIAFDNGELSPLYIGFLKHFRINNYNWATSVVSEVRGVTMWVHRWPHGGKRNAQALTFNFIRDIFDDRKRRYLNPRKSTAAMRQHILVMTDSDNFLYNNALRNLAHNFDKNPEKAALAGYMTCMSSGWKAVNFLRLMQDTEYVGGEMNRSFELMMGTVNCLPGGFTAMRYDALLSVADRYFTTLDNETITDFHRNYLGEDRYLTHIMHQVFPRYSMGFCPSARCKTDPPPSVMKLVKQRRRWWLGAISNEAYMLTDIEIWKKYKFMIIFKLFQLSWKALTVSQLILAVLAISGLDKNNMLPYVLSVGIPLCTAWVVTILTGIKLGHYKVIWMYPLMQIPNTLVCFFVDVYTLCTWYTRSWGGARFEGKYEKAEGAA